MKRYLQRFMTHTEKGFNIFNCVLKIKKYIVLAFFLFLLFFTLGYIHSLIAPELLDQMVEGLDPLVEKLASLSNWQFALIIFFNNTLKVLLSMFLGVFFGIIPFFFLAFNGYILGVVATGVDLHIFFASIGPHGILEIPAFLIGAGMGLSLGFKVLKHGKSVKVDWGELKQLTILIIIMLLLASLIETYITPIIINLLI